MIDLIRQQEAIPAAYPATPDGLSDAAQTLDAASIWARIEAYTAHRFSDRQVVWVFEAGEDDDWSPALTPVASLSAEKWESGAWASSTLPEGPLGYCVPGDGMYRVTAQVGAGPVPAPVSEAFKRLAEYSVEISKDGFVSGHPSHTSHSHKITEDLAESFARQASWAARAIQNSGAADLLRPYRRA